MRQPPPGLISYGDCPKEVQRCALSVAQAQVLVSGSLWRSRLSAPGGHGARSHFCSSRSHILGAPLRPSRHSSFLKQTCQQPMSHTLNLNYWVLGDDANRVFPVEISNTKSVGALKKAIKEKKPVSPQMPEGCHPFRNFRCT
ncbi:uncharacterized protein EI90DRAFT_2109534 [Cantharellus anzutake]|uniref:uncharacterized protein n=1 Tax=Cantharellus anzutake TaxID=1750568 RepID=UPI001906BD9C|nr:uncharacterized protein EI90DRAFT_2109534 [Cantharellus anzutake]KAF8325637.1 hypothetical protein EI90DRAFT_2109534 [Cantharellus anzutake]